MGKKSSVSDVDKFHKLMEELLDQIEKADTTEFIAAFTESLGKAEQENQKLLDARKVETSSIHQAVTV